MIVAGTSEVEQTRSEPGPCASPGLLLPVPVYGRQRPLSMQDLLRAAGTRPALAHRATAAIYSKE
jgi:hypothetical protein